VIADNERAFPVALMCRVLLVSRSGYYDWKRRKPSTRAQKNAELDVVIKRFLANRKAVQARHGSRWVRGRKAFSLAAIVLPSA